jgi:hypothetical protein
VHVSKLKANTQERHDKAIPYFTILPHLSYRYSCNLVQAKAGAGTKDFNAWCAGPLPVDFSRARAAGFFSQNALGSYVHPFSNRFSSLFMVM